MIFCECNDNIYFSKTLLCTPRGGGGNVIQLPGRAFFVSNCYPYCNMFIVGEDDKRELWNAQFEKFNSKSKKWEEPSPYRASIIENKSDLEKLIWNGE